jgi:tetratricopeptide (TPR) repeat protein
MATVRWAKLLHSTALAALWLAASAAPIRAADEDESLRDKVLALNNITGNNAIEGEIKTLLAAKDKVKQLLPVALRVIRAKDQPLNYNGAYILARVAQDLKDFESAEALFTLCKDEALKLQSGTRLAQSFGGLIDIYYEDKKFEKTVKLCREFLELGGDETVDRLKPAVVERMLQSLNHQGKFDDALKLVDNLVEAEGEKGWWALQLRANVLQQAGKNKEAAEGFETVLQRLGKDKNLTEEERARYVDRTRYLLTGVYVDLNQIDKAADYLKTLLDKKPDSPTYNNDLGYIWADHDMNLDEAEKLIRKALDEDRKQRKADPDLTPEEDKDSAAYLDSLGWVLFKQKKYEEARKVLAEAVKDPEGQHIEILDHLAQVHLALKDKKAAVEAWKKGVEYAGTTKREQERKAAIEKKLKDTEE